MKFEVPKIIRDTYKGIVFLAVLALVAGVLFYMYEGRPFQDCIYWSLVTMTTVGYGDIYPTSYTGKMISVFLASTGVILYGYLGGVIVSSIMESSLSDVFGMNKCKFTDHFILCGWTQTSEVVLSELLFSGNQVAVITENKDDIPRIKRKGSKKKVFPIYGDPSNIEVLRQAGIEDAKVIILCMEDDSKNLITTIHLKKLNPDARIIVRTNKGELKETMEMAGVTYVATPHELSGRLIASAAFEPDVANMVEDITTATDEDGYDIRQFTIDEDIKGPAGKINKIIRKKTNATLMGIAKPGKDGKWKVQPNPKDDYQVNPGDAVILLGNEEEFRKVEKLLKVKQGR